MTVSEPGPPVPRLRDVRPIRDESGGCYLIYDLERTFVVEVPRRFRRAASELGQTDGLPPAFSRWLAEEDLLTCEPFASRSQGRRPSLPAVSDVSLDMSGACNMGCSYCFEQDIASRLGPMSRETAMASVDFAFAQAKASSRIAFHFGSGEPLIRFDLLVQIVEESERRAAQTGKAVSFDLTTNGTLVTEDMAAFLAAHPFSVRVSCDGPAHVHDRFRPMRGGQASYASVLRGLDILLRHLPDRVTVNSVLCAGTRLSELWAWAKEIGLRRFHVIKVGAWDERAMEVDERELGSYAADLDRICEDLFADLEAGRTPIDYQPITKIVRRLMIPDPITRFCGVAGSYLGVASNGKVYPCFRHLGLKEYNFGDVHQGIDDAKRQTFLGGEAADVDTRPVCSNCWARYLCGGGCYADSVVYGGDRLRPHVGHCPFWRAEIETAIRFFDRLRQADPYHCLRLFGDDPEKISDEHALDEMSFPKRRNCF